MTIKPFKPGAIDAKTLLHMLLERADDIEFLGIVALSKDCVRTIEATGNTTLKEIAYFGASWQTVFNALDDASHE